MHELAMTPQIRDARERVRAFMEEYVYPNEAALGREDAEAEALLKDLRARAKAAGLWAPFIGPEAGGSGLGFLPYAYLNEIIGRSHFAPLVFGCQAPDTGNAEILHQFGTAEQRRRWLEPLVAGEIRSYFAMTEPEVSGADPTGLRTTAVLDGDHWVIDGHKWFSSGAEGAAFAIVMAVTEPEEPPHRRMSQIIVPAEARGVRRPAGPQADGPELDRGLRGRDPGVPPAHPRRGRQDRQGRRGTRGDLGDQVLRRQGAPRRDRPGDPGARRHGAHGPDAPVGDVQAGARRQAVRRPRRGAPDGREPPHPAVVRRRRRLGLRRRRAVRRLVQGAAGQPLAPRHVPVDHAQRPVVGLLG